MALWLVCQELGSGPGLTWREMRLANVSVKVSDSSTSLRAVAGCRLKPRNHVCMGVGRACALSATSSDHLSRV